MQIYNSQTRKKEEFVPLVPGKVSIYACGPTVYNYFHVGNARPFIVFDVLRRYLEHRGYEVTFVQNFTDIDDKMIKRAQEEGITVKELGDRFIREYYQDAGALGIRKATVHPRASVEKALSTLSEMSGVLGLLSRKTEEGLPEEIQRLADERAQARKEKNWKKSDELRDALKAAGYTVEDTPQGQKIAKA